MKFGKKARSFIRSGLLSSVFILQVTSAHADPVTDAVLALINIIGSSIGAAAVTWTDIAVFALKTAAAIALSYVATSIFMPDAKTPKPNGVQGSIRLGGDIPRAFIAGKYATAGSLVYGGTWGIDTATNMQNAYVTQVISLSDLPLNALKEIWLGSNKLTVNPGLSPSTLQGTPIIEYRQDGTDYLWYKFYDGTQTTADTFLTSVFGSDPVYPITSNFIGTGCAYIIMTARFNSKLFSGIPNFKFAVEGAKWYDPRFDTSVGGSGSQRWATPSTWVYTDNPMVINYNIFRGVSYGTDWIWGPQGIVDVKLPLASWTAAMSACDVTTTDSLGATVATYRCGAEISVDMQPVDVIETINMACNARIAEVGGIYKPLVGASAASVMSFTDADILIDESTSFDFFPSQATVVNGLTATYPEPAEGWVQKDAPMRTNPTYEAADGKRLLTSVNYAAVPYASQVQQLMDSAIEESRKFKKHTIPLPPKFWVLEPNDTITWTSTRNTYSSKKFRVLSIVDKADLEVLAVIGETDPADYSFNTGTDYLTHFINPPVVTYPSTLAPDIAMTALMQLKRDLQDITETLLKVQFALQSGDASSYNMSASATQDLRTEVIAGQSATASYLLSLQAQISSTVDPTAIVTAAVSVEALARVAGDGANASLISSVSATVGTHTTTLTTHQNVLNGISGSWGVTLDINGAITGRISLDGLGSTSSLNFLASQVNIYTTAGPFPVFSVSGTTVLINGTLQANSIIANMITAGNIQLTHMSSSSVDTPNLVTDAASIGGSSVTGADVLTDPSSPSSTPSTVTTFTGTFTGDPIFIWCYLDMALGSAGNHVFGINVYVDAGLIYSIPQTISILNSSRQPHMILVPHTPSAGSHTYAVAILGSSTAITAKAGSVMSILQRKR